MPERKLRKKDCLNNLQNRTFKNSDGIKLAIHFTKVDLRLNWWEHDAIEEGITVTCLWWQDVQVLHSYNFTEMFAQKSL